MRRNKPDQYFHLIAFDDKGRRSGEAANITCILSKDGALHQALDLTNPSEIGSTGEYRFSLRQDETDGYTLSFVPTCSTSGVQVFGVPSNVIYTTQDIEDLLPRKSLEAR
jgi:hypothetical protein